MLNHAGSPTLNIPVGASLLAIVTVTSVLTKATPTS